MIGLGAFAATSVVCALAPTTNSLILARCVQGMAAALVVPNSLAIVSASFRTETAPAPSARGRAWAALRPRSDLSSADG